MNKIIRLLLLTILLPIISIAQKGVYYQPTLGALITSESVHPVGGLSIGYAFGKNKVGVYNQVGTGYVKLGGLEYQRDFGDTLNRLVSIVGLSVHNSYYEGGSTSRNKSINEGKQSFDLGIGYKRRIKNKWYGLITIRMSAFQGTDHTTNEERVLTPITVSIGISKL